MLCGEEDEKINRIISQCGKLVQTEYKSRHDWVGKVIHWELYKKLKFDQTNKWYRHKAEFFPENETHNINCVFEIQRNFLNLARRLHLIKKKKEKKKKKKKKKKENRIYCVVGFAVPANFRVKFKEIEKRDEYLDIAIEQRKLWSINVTVVLIIIGTLRTVPKRLERGLEELEIGGRIETI